MFFIEEIYTKRGVKKNRISGVKSGMVEPTGFEPVSKQIRRKLSTCLFMY